MYSRLEQHVKDASGTKSRRPWVTELEQQGMYPELEILETIETGPDADLVAQEREKYCILEYLKSGTPLHNVAGVPHAYPQRSAITQSMLFVSARLRVELSAI